MTPRPTSITAAIDQAHAAISAQRFGEAEYLARWVLRSNPTHVLAALVLGHALMLQTRLPEAIPFLRRVRRRHPDARISTLLAKALRASGDSEAAVTMLREILASRPIYPIAAVELAEILGDLARFDDAKAVLAEALREAPGEMMLRMALGYVHLKSGDRIRAREIFMTVRVRAPERRDAVVAMAQVLALDGEHLEAARLFARALEIGPQDIEVRVALAKSLLELGRTSDAEANLRFVARAPRGFGVSLTALAHASRGRVFLRPSQASNFLAAALPTDAPRASDGDSDRVPAAPKP